MNLISLTTTNWRNFYGKHELVFSNKKGKHVTLIHGQNGTGKTTMISAIKWCLYRTTPDFDKEIDKPNIDNVEIAHWDTWNHKVVDGKLEKTTPNENNSEFEVELRFEHEGVEYRATRKARQKDMRGIAIAPGKDTFTLFKKDDTKQQKLINEPQSAISRILPGELSDYFLFSGETVGKMLDSSANRGNGYKNAVRDILGFTLSDDAIKDLEQVLLKNTRKKNTLIQADNLTKVFGDKLIKLNEDKEIITTQLDELKHELKVAENTYDEITIKISESNHEDEKRLGAELKVKENSMRTEEKRKKTFLNEKVNLIEQYGFAIFGTFLNKEVASLKQEKYEGRLPAGYIDSFVQKLLTQNKCICERDLINNTHEYNVVEAMLDTANTSLIDDRLTEAFSATAFFKGRASNFISNLERISNQIEASDRLISSYNNACSDIESKLKGLGNTNIDNLLRDREIIKNTIKVKRDDAASKQVTLNLYISEIGKINKDIDKTKTNNPELEMRENYERVVNVTIERLKSNQKRHEKSAIKQIAHTVQKNISEYSHNDLHAKVDQNFNVSLFVSGTNTQAAGVGEGTEMLSKLSFITSLISHSKLRKNAESSWAASGTIAPFVIDAPFADMDRDYQKSTLKFLPKQSHQLIIFLSNGQWQEDYEEVIGDFIGKRYYYKNHVKPGKKLTQSPLPVKGKKYEVEVDDWDKDYYGATIEEIN